MAGTQEPAEEGDPSAGSCVCGGAFASLIGGRPFLTFATSEPLIPSEQILRSQPPSLALFEYGAFSQSYSDPNESFILAYRSIRLNFYLPSNIYCDLV